MRRACLLSLRRCHTHCLLTRSAISQQGPSLLALRYTFTSPSSWHSITLSRDNDIGCCKVSCYPGIPRKEIWRKECEWQASDTSSGRQRQQHSTELDRLASYTVLGDIAYVSQVTHIRDFTQVLSHHYAVSKLLVAC